jgi:hypothetical protein
MATRGSMGADAVNFALNGPEESASASANAGTVRVRCAFQSSMTDDKMPLAHLGLERALALRWVLRDIKAKRLKLSPVSTVDLNILTELGLIEMRDGVPVLTNAGHAALD